MAKNRYKRRGEFVDDPLGFKDECVPLSTT